MIRLVVGLAFFQKALGVTQVGAGLTRGFVIALCFAVAKELPGYVFFWRYTADKFTLGSKFAFILIVSMILVVWQ
jgi:hypothetical protein